MLLFEIIGFLFKEVECCVWVVFDKVGLVDWEKVMLVVLFGGE